MSRVRTWAARLARGHTRLAVRLFLFNALLVFLPVAGLWYLDAYEQHLLEQQERAMVQQARLLAAALARDARPVASSAAGSGRSALLDRLEQSSDVRLRIVAPGRPRRRRLAARARASTGVRTPPATSAPEVRAAARAMDLSVRRMARSSGGAALTVERGAAAGRRDDPGRARAASRPPKSIAPSPAATARRRGCRRAASDR